MRSESLNALNHGMPTDITERKSDLPDCTLNEQQLDIQKLALQLNLMIVINL